MPWTATRTKWSGPWSIHARRRVGATHGGYCCFHTGSSSRVGGFPCVDFSTAGSRKGIHGPLLSTVFAFGAKARLTRSPCVGVENVAECPDFLMPDAFGVDFEWHINMVTEPADVGFDFINRTRTPTLKVLKLYGQCIGCDCGEEVHGCLERARGRSRTGPHVAFGVCQAQSAARPPFADRVSVLPARHVLSSMFTFMFAHMLVTQAA